MPTVSLPVDFDAGATGGGFAGIECNMLTVDFAAPDPDSYVAGRNRTSDVELA